MEVDYNFAVFELVFRLFCGVLFIYQGFDKLFVVGMKNVIETFSSEANRKRVPKFFVVVSSYFSSIVEFVGGALLILGLFKPIVLTLLGIDLVIVAIAFSTIQAMWDMKNVFPRLMLVGILMVTPNSWEVFSLRNLIEYFINK
ncbi:MAG: DoxX family protein [Bacteroidetes bacterium]|nr:DoxX family protein [Bacteroidota bacterium]